MSSHTRDRSPSSADYAQYIIKQAAASSHPPLDDSSSFPNLDSDLSHGQYHSHVHSQAPSDLLGDPTFSQADQRDFYLGNGGYDQLGQGQHSLASSHDPSIAQHTFLQSSGLSGQAASPGYPFTQAGQSNNHVSLGPLSQGSSSSGANESTAFPSFDFDPNFGSNASLDPSMLNDINVDPLNIQTNENGSMASIQQQHNPTAPHLLPEMARRSSNSPSPSASPSFTNATFAMNRPRNTSESLDPSSAMFPGGVQNDWAGINLGAYRGHRRNPSDNYSDYSNHSNQQSPYLPTLDSFDNGHSSPLLASQDPAFNNDLGLQQFTLNDPSPQQQHPQESFHSPGHSPHISPRLVAQQHALPQFTADNNFGMNADMHFPQQQNGLDMFPGPGQEPFPSLSHNNSVDFGAADQMSPPEISINYAPPSQPVDNARPANADGEALSPPMRSRLFFMLI